MATGSIFFVIILLAIAVPLVLYFFIQSETADQPVMKREDAERKARTEYEDTNDAKRR
ncbi:MULTISPECIES: hypothetical protein [unclassified Haladaptatus]|uniref:hypothetical protein n=1 Tax=unclassified Haladaptatus TaxID=2622732 RepID=UPI0023E81BED|nr:MULTISPECIES: hypothetical protein [unclassified Haladaptatus]